MSITKNIFGTLPEGDVYAYRLDNGKGLSAEIITLGGIIKNIEFDGVDVVLGHDDVKEYRNDPTYFGALIGRNSNRIADGEFELDGKRYTLAKNNNDVCNLHGGLKGFSYKIWDVEEKDCDEPALILSTYSPDGEEGFPGRVEVKVTYTLTKENSLKIHYEGTTDEKTILNMTNHSYFNLNGHASGDIKGHRLKLNCGFYTPNNKFVMPTGEIKSVKNSPFDFTETKTIGSGFENPNEQFELIGGYDHNFVIDGTGYRKFVEAEGEKTHIVMEGFTDRPGVQLYTSNALADGTNGKNGAKYNQFGGFCLETQVFPDAIHFSHFPSAIIEKGEKYDTVTEYKFSKR